jgi:hypothetical protein
LTKQLLLGSRKHSQNGLHWLWTGTCKERDIGKSPEKSRSIEIKMTFAKLTQKVGIKQE